MSKTFNMSQCNPGDILLTRDGTLVNYVGLRSEYKNTPHIIKYPNETLGTRTNEGCVFDYDEEYMKDKNISGFLPK